VDYITTTDEEDNDSDPDDDKVNDAILKITPDDEHPAELPRAKKQVKKDVVRTLIEQDDELLTRDLQARLLKIKLWKLQRKKLDVPLSEEYDLNEDFTWINYDDDKDIHYLMGTKYKTSYRKGDQLFNCYGLRTNRFLLLNYGFCIRNNKYNSLGFKVFVNVKKKEGGAPEEENDESRY
jgi:hypothetical protein